MTDDLKFYPGDRVRFGGYEGVLENSVSEEWPVRLWYKFGGVADHFTRGGYLHASGEGPRLELIERGPNAPKPKRKLYAYIDYDVEAGRAQLVWFDDDAIDYKLKSRIRAREFDREVEW